jgi:uncharacterized membrane protein HdeD (DUF308 family)
MAQAQTGNGWGLVLAWGILSILVGLIAFAWPFSATLAVTVIVGILFLVAGISGVAAGIASHDHEARLYAIAWGVLSILLGLFLAADPLSGAFSLTLLVVIGLAVRGVMLIVWGTRSRRLRTGMIVFGAIDLLLALLLLLTSPWSAMTLPGYILGASFVFNGVGAVLAGLDHRKGAPAFARPDAI